MFDFVYGNHNARLKRLQINNFFYLRKVECDVREIVFGVRTHMKKRKKKRWDLVMPFSYFMSLLIWPPPKSRHDATRPLQSDKRERVGMHRCFAARCHSHPKIPLPLSHLFNSLFFRFVFFKSLYSFSSLCISPIILQPAALFLSLNSLTPYHYNISIFIF